MVWTPALTREHQWLSRSDPPFCAALDTCYPPGFWGVMPVYELLAGPLSCAFWLKPVSPFGLLAFTTVHTQVHLRLS